MNTGCYALPALAILILRLWSAAPGWHYRNLVYSWACFTALFISLIYFLLPEPISVMRYFLPLLPIGYGLYGLALSEIQRRFSSGPVLFTALIIAVASMPAVSALPRYLHEISHPYPTANQAVADYLLSHAMQDDTVYASPEPLNYPLMFYAGHYLKFSDLLDTATPLPVERLRTMAPFLFRDTTFPDWYIAFGKRQDEDETFSETGTLSYFTRPHPEHNTMVSYRYQQVAVLNAFWNQTQRPEINYHTYGPVTDFDRNTEAVYVYRRSAVAAAQ